MAKVWPIQTNFTAGQLSARLHGRVDVNKYSNGLKTQKNAYSLPHGGVVRRGGFNYVAEAKGVASGSELVANGTFASNITGWTNKSVGSGSSIAHATNLMNIVSVDGSNYGWAEDEITTVAGKRYVMSFVIGAGAINVQIGTATGGVDILASTSYAVGTHTIEFIALSTATFIGFKHTTGATHTLDTVSVKLATQDAKVRLVRFEFSVTQAYILEFGNLYIRVYKDNGQIQTGGAPVEIVTPFTTAQLFDLYFAQSADTLYIAHPSHAPRKLTRTSDIAWTLATLSFTSAPSDFVAGAGDYPSCVTFFEERLYWAGTNNKPQTIWASKSGDFLNMNQGTGLDDESLAFTLATDDVNVIRWLKASDVLLIGTVGGEFKLHGSGNPVTPSNVRVVQETKYGSSTVTPITSGRAVIFNQRATKKLRQMIFDLNVEGFVAPDLTILAEDITGDGITHMAYQQEPDSVVWAVRDDGVLLGLTYQRDQQVVAWHQHPIGGTGACVESVAVIPSADGKSDELWASVKRTIAGATVRTIEYLNDSIYVDSGLQYSGSPTATLSGLGHLEGESVQVLGDGAVFPNQTVSGGSITLSDTVSTASVGLAYTTEIVTLAPELPQPDGSSFGKKKGWNRIILNLYQTLGISVNGTQLVFRSGGDPMDSAPPAFTGQFDITNLGWKEADSSITIKQEQPMGMTLISLTGELSVND
jgi:hypothetical protein